MVRDSAVEAGAIEDRQVAGTVRAQFDRERTLASTAVVTTLADVMGADPAELDPLYSTVDPDGLDDLLRVRNGTDGELHVTFTHEDHAITVDGDGVITVSRLHDPGAENTGRDVGR